MSLTNTTMNLDKAIAHLDERCILWQSHLRSTESLDRGSLELSINQFYQLVGKPPPQLVWCESPWQMSAMAAVLEKQTGRSAIKKWSNHPANLRLSENEFEQLWNNMWRQLDAQLSETRRKDIMIPDATSQSAKEERWQNGWISKLTLRKTPLVETKWNETSRLIRDECLRIGKEMRALCAIRFENNTDYAELERRYREKMAAWISNSFDSQLQNEMLAFASAGFTLNVFERLTTESIANVGLEILKGHAREEFDKICTPEERKAFEFATTFLLINAMSSIGTRNAQDILSMIPFYDYLCDELPDLPVGPANRKRAKTYLNILRQTTHILPFDHVVFISEHPLVFKTDDAGRLHSDDGPAVAFGDGLKIYSWHGITVPKKIIDSPNSITVAEILRQWNAEIRRVMIERYGLQRFIETSGAVEISRDECGILYKKELTNDEDLVMVKVINSSPEPDGTFKHYFLRVPPTMKTAREAVAWTFNVGADEYSPEHQT